MKARILAPLFFALAACGAAAESDSGGNDIVNVPHTDVERQSIGNCWLYAEASWAESMHRTATGESFDISQSYWTYWHWFDQIVNGTRSIETGGWWETANQIAGDFGIMPEKDFISADSLDEMSTKQKEALAAINESLKNGALSQAKFGDRAVARRELDRAWGLSPEQSALLDRVFGAGVERTFRSGAQPEGSMIRAADFDVSYTNAPGAAPVKKKLAQAIADWRRVTYRGDRRDFLLRVQRALHDQQPVIITWFVDFNALDKSSGPQRGSFNLTTLNAAGPGQQGGHMTVLEDYQAKLSDGTVLAAGVTLDPAKAADKDLLTRALDPSTEIQFLRVKNSWGTVVRPTAAYAEGMPGYHDLYLDYLNGPVKECQTGADGKTDTKNCPWNKTPLGDVVLPPGY